MYTSVSFRVVVDDKEKLVTSGNGNIEDVIYKNIKWFWYKCTANY